MSGSSFSEVDMATEFLGTGEDISKPECFLVLGVLKPGAKKAHQTGRDAHVQIL